LSKIFKNKSIIPDQEEENKKIMIPQTAYQIAMITHKMKKKSLLLIK